MRPLWLVPAFLACGGPQAQPTRMPDDPTGATEFADEQLFVPSYGKPELSRALTAERGKQASLEKRIAELSETETSPDDQLRVALLDLGVQRAFITSLERCEADGRHCPPRLDEPVWSYDPETGYAPPLTAPLRYDAPSWRDLTSELFGRSCACRTIACVDSLFVAIAKLEEKPMPAVLEDDAAALSIVRARECLMRLRGKRP